MHGTGFRTHPARKHFNDELYTSSHPDPRTRTARRRSVGRIIGITLFSFVAGLTSSPLIAAGFVVWTIQRSFPQLDGHDRPRRSRPRRRRSSATASASRRSTADDTHDLFFAQGYVHAQDRFWEMDFRRHVTTGACPSCSANRSCRPTGSCARSAGGGRRAGGRPALDRRRALLRRVRRGRQRRTSRRATTAPTRSPRVRHARPAEPRTTRSRRGRPATRWPGSRRWPGTSAATSRPRSDRALLAPAYHASRSTSCTRPIRSTAIPSIVPDGCRAERHLAAATVRRRPRPRARSTCCRRWPTASTGDAAADRRRRDGHRLELVGVSRRAHRERQAPPGQRPAPGRLHAQHLAPDRAALRVSARCPFDVAGFSFSGVPGVIIGHNARIAWGFTNLDPTSPTCTSRRSTATVLADGKPVPLVTRTRDDQGRRRRRDARDPLHRDGPRPGHGTAASPRTRTRARTVVRRLSKGEYAVALHWTALDPGHHRGRLVRPRRRARTSTGVPRRRRAVRRARPEPGLRRRRRQHRLPVPRPAPDPRQGRRAMPQPGWDSAYDWTGLHPVRGAAGVATTRRRGRSSPRTTRSSVRLPYPLPRTGTTAGGRRASST